MPDPRRERHYAVVLLIVSAVVLTAGTLVKRHFAHPQPQAAPPPDLERLQHLTAERRMSDLSAYLAETADLPARRLVSPNGLIWDEVTVIAPPAPPDTTGTTVVAADGHPIPLSRANMPRGLPFSVWRAAPGAGLPHAATVRPKAGDWVLAVGRNQAREIAFTHGLYVGEEKQRCGAFEYEAAESSAPLTPALAGGGVFTLDGGLIAYIAECDGRPIAIAASTIAETLARPLPQEEVFEHGQGYRLSPDTPGLVTAVWEDSPAAAAGLRPGDVIAPGASSERPLTVKRGNRTVKLDWPDAAAESPAPRGMSFDPTTASVRSVAPDSPAAAAGIVAGDLVVRVAGSPVDGAESAARAIGRAKGAVLLTIERGGRRMDTLVQP
jgi:hypothetical protein